VQYKEIKMEGKKIIVSDEGLKDLAGEVPDPSVVV
jgi:hypothetical protein